MIKNKPVSVGYKLFTVASDGYLLGFRIYRGKGGYSRPHSVLHHVVVSLVEPWANMNRRLFFRQPVHFAGPVRPSATDEDPFVRYLSSETARVCRRISGNRAVDW